MPRVNLIGASNRQTNSTCVFGSMAGLAPTSTVRPHITGIHGYKYARTAANGTDWNTGATLGRDVEGLTNGCGFNRGCSKGKTCVKFVGYTTTGVAYRTGAKLLA
jgi:hypothetical protein